MIVLMSNNQSEIYMPKKQAVIDTNKVSNIRLRMRHPENIQKTKLSRRLVDYVRPLNRRPAFQRGIKRCGGRGSACRSFPLSGVSSIFFLVIFSQSVQILNMNLLNKIALITSANDGIGKAIIEELVSKGLKVIGLARDINQLKLIAEELKGKPGKFYPLQCDLSLQNDIESALEWIEKNLGAVDILINNASVSLDWSIITGGIEELKKSLDINVIGLTLITKGILQLMKSKGLDNGAIVIINDIFGLKSLPLANDRSISPAYASSKSALNTLTESLRLELAQNESNIKIINISPGLVETELTQQWLKENPRLALKPKNVSDAVLFSLQTPENVLIKDLIITPIREII